MMFVFKLLGWIVGLVVAAIIALLLFLRFGTPVYDWHQQMTVVIDTPDGPVSGWSVSAVRWKEHAIKAEGMGWSLKVTGEAVVVDLGSSASRPRYLFALMKGAGTTEYMGSVAAASLSGRKGRVIDEDLFGQIKNRQGAAAKPIAVPRFQYPLLVTFADINDPASVARVDPDDLAAHFGPGYALSSITLAITDEPVTKGRVEAVLGWLGEYYDKHLDGNRLETVNAENRFANSLASGAFDTEKN
ncbi:hypothetical protein [Hoeflea alexandrii]|uniref:hypothetical protein n=1 Tax=Hoeflea alexandrii TaxID=288436 RepID=UPI0022AF2585|nr:hypothetical protein [Hoeflea alexandrii]MCZ4288703.1 hypothetical protein [Hoeflea alexandrii]